jgi:hypothetical protein
MNESAAMLKEQKPFLVKGQTNILSGRDEGRMLAETALQYLQSLEPDSVLPLDFSKVRFIDFSCVDEFLTRILRRIVSGELGTRFIVLQGMTPTVEESIAAVFAIRELVCPKITKDGEIELIGKIGTELMETYRLAAKRGRITARDVKEIAPRVGTSAISNRLAKLQKMGLLVRRSEVGMESGGRQFIYEPVR